MGKKALVLCHALSAFILGLGSWVPQVAGADKVSYALAGQCDGFPRLRLTTAPGFCVGLLADGFSFPRGIVQLKTGDLLLIDMGGWEPSRGSIWLLQKVPDRQHYTRKKVLAGLDRPHGVALGPDGLPYVGVASGVFRFDPYATSVEASKADIIGARSGVPGLPGNGKHPLLALVFDPHGDLFVSLGAASDNCETATGGLPDPTQPCAEAEGTQARGVIRKYRMAWPEGRVQSWTTYAFGLRNALALAVHPHSHRLLQGENARDTIHRRIPGMTNDEELPHDELNVIEEGRHYGWPYCYDAGRPSPEFPRTDCGRYQSPVFLLPPHAAPLGMTYYFASLFPPAFAGQLIVGYHGYRKYGHRLVMVPVDASGLPTGQPPVDLITRWVQPLGAPVDVKVAADGAILITEDRNKTVLRLFFEGTRQ